MGLAAEFAFNLVFFGVFTELLTSWLDGDLEITLIGVLIRGGLFASLMLGTDLWKERQKRRAAPGQAGEASSDG